MSGGRPWWEAAARAQAATPAASARAVTVPRAAAAPPRVNSSAPAVGGASVQVASLTAQRGSLSARVGVIGVELAGLQAQVAQLESVIREVQDREQGLVEVRGSVRALPLADVRGWAGVRQRRCEGLVVSVDDRLRAAVLAVERVLVDLWRQHSLVSGQIDDLNAERRALNASLSSVVAELGRLS